MNRLRKLTFAAAALSLLTAGTAAAQNYGPPPGPPPGYGHPPGYGGPGYGGPGYGPGPAWHHWHRGDRFYGPREIVPNWAYYHLAPPPYGYQWVRYPHQYVLIGINTGIVAQVFVP